MRKKRVFKHLLLCFLIFAMITGCESIAQVSADSDKLNEYLEAFQEKSEEV